MDVNIWSFDTDCFSVRVDALHEDYLDLSFDDMGEIAAALDAGELRAFCARAQVLCRATGEVLAEDYLGNCIYESPSDFRDHKGVNNHPHTMSYFSDMVRTVLRGARAVVLSRATVYRELADRLRPQ